MRQAVTRLSDEHQIAQRNDANEAWNDGVLGRLSRTQKGGLGKRGYVRMNAAGTARSAVDVVLLSFQCERNEENLLSYLN